MINIIIADKNIQNIKIIMNNIINKLEAKDIKTFVANNKIEIQEIENSNKVNLILINENLNFIYSSNNCSVFYYR